MRPPQGEEHVGMPKHPIGLAAPPRPIALFSLARPGALAAVLACSACGGTIWVNKDYRDRPRPTREEVLLLPVEVHRLPDSMRSAVEAQMNEEVSHAFGPSSVTLHLIRERFMPAGYGNLPWQLAKGMYLRGRHASSGLLVGQDHEWLDGLGDHARRFLGWAAAALGDPSPGPNVQPRRRYLLAFYLERYGRTDDPKKGIHLQVRVMGGIFDAHRKRTVAVTWQDLELRPTPEAFRRALTGVGARLRQALSSAGR